MVIINNSPKNEKLFVMAQLGIRSGRFKVPVTLNFLYIILNISHVAISKTLFFLI